MIFRKKKKETTCTAHALPRNPAECIHVFRYEAKTTAYELTCLACEHVLVIDVK